MNFDLVWIYKKKTSPKGHISPHLHTESIGYPDVINSSKYQGCLSKHTGTLILKPVSTAPRGLSFKLFTITMMI